MAAEEQATKEETHDYKYWQVIGNELAYVHATVYEIKSHKHKYNDEDSIDM